MKMSLSEVCSWKLVKYCTVPLGLSMVFLFFCNLNEDVRGMQYKLLDMAGISDKVVSSSSEYWHAMLVSYLYLFGIYVGLRWHLFGSHTGPSELLNHNRDFDSWTWR